MQSRHARKISRLSGFDIQDPDVARSADARRDECQLIVVRRKRRLIIKSIVVRQPLESGTVRVDSVNICRAVALGRKYDPFAIGGKHRVVVHVATGVEPVLPASVPVGNEQFSAGRSEAARQNRVLGGRWLRRGKCQGPKQQKKRSDRYSELRHGEPSLWLAHRACLMEFQSCGLAGR